MSTIGGTPHTVINYIKKENKIFFWWNFINMLLAVMAIVISLISIF